MKHQTRKPQRALSRRIERYWAAALEWAANTTKPPVVHFFGRHDPDRLSNHALTPTRFQGHLYRTAEHAYLVQKARFLGLDRLATDWARGEGFAYAYGTHYDLADPKRIKSWSSRAFAEVQRSKPHLLRQWEAKRANIMFQIVLAKFRSNGAARNLLLATGHAFLAESCPRDAFWGIGLPHLSEEEIQKGPFAGPRTWGANTLGRILMAVRNIMRQLVTHSRLEVLKTSQLRAMAKLAFRDDKTYPEEVYFRFPTLNNYRKHQLGRKRAVRDSYKRIYGHVTLASRSSFGRLVHSSGGIWA